MQIAYLPIFGGGCANEMGEEEREEYLNLDFSEESPEEEEKKKKGLKVLQYIVYTSFLCVVAAIFFGVYTEITGKSIASQIKGTFEQAVDSFHKDRSDREGSETGNHRLSDIVYAAISHDGIRIRKEPSATAELAADRRIRQGEGVYGTGNVSEDGSWVEIYINESSTGWIAGSLVETNGNLDAETWIEQNYISIIIDFYLS